MTRWNTGRDEVEAMLVAGDLEQVAPSAENAALRLAEAERHLRSAELVAAADPAGGQGRGHTHRDAAAASSPPVVVTVGAHPSPVASETFALRVARIAPHWRGGGVEMTEPRTYTPVADDAELRQRAVKRLEDKRGLTAHIVAYVSVNLLLVAIWWITDAGFFWPLFPIFGWGIGLAFHVWAVVWPAAGEQQIQAEMEKLRNGGG
jgi:hypothetical protein